MVLTTLLLNSILFLVNNRVEKSLFADSLTGTGINREVVAGTTAAKYLNTYYILIDYIQNHTLRTSVLDKQRIEASDYEVAAGILPLLNATAIYLPAANAFNDAVWKFSLPEGYDKLDFLTPELFNAFQARFEVIDRNSTLFSNTVGFVAKRTTTNDIQDVKENGKYYVLNPNGAVNNHVTSILDIESWIPNISKLTVEDVVDGKEGNIQWLAQTLQSGTQM